MRRSVVCFDLDDTLYKEIDFVMSAYKEIAEAVGHQSAVAQMLEWYFAGKNVFGELIRTYDLAFSMEDCLRIYRNHYPTISLEPGLMFYLDGLKKNEVKIGLITDGRSISQRNKISALGLEGFFDVEIISEEFGTTKPSLRNYQVVMDQFQDREVFTYVGDNPVKDFIAPNLLGWKTYCLKDNGRNIHRQVFSLPKDYLPQYVITKFEEIEQQ